MTMITNSSSVPQFRRNDGMDHLVNNVVANLILGYVRRMLITDQHCINTHWTPIRILDRHLALAIGAQIRQHAFLSQSGEAATDAMRQCYWQRHQLRRFSARKPKHHPLVARTDCCDLLIGHKPIAAHFERTINPLSNIGRLTVNGDHHAAGIGVKTIRSISISDFLDRLANDLLNWDVSPLVGYLADNDNQGIL
jgi:hypothetical protein